MYADCAKKNLKRIYFTHARSQSALNATIVEEEISALCLYVGTAKRNIHQKEKEDIDFAVPNVDL